MKAVVTKGVKATVKKGKAKGESVYQNQVINVNKALKAERKSLGGCIKTLLIFKKEIGLDAQRVKILTFITKDNDAFRSFKKIVRTSKYKGKDLGTYSPFYVLQALNKNLAEMTK